MNAANRQAGLSQIVLLVVIAVALTAAYVAIYLYTGGEKDMLTVETRGVGMISALSTYKRESGAYPETLDKLVPKYVSAVSKCPGDRKSTRLNSSHTVISYAVFCLKKKKKQENGDRIIKHQTEEQKLS